MSDFYYDTHPNNPSNQDEPVSRITYEVNIDEYETFYLFDNFDDAKRMFNEIINGLTDFHEIELKKYVGDDKPILLEHTTADACFLQLKQKIAELSSLENSFAWSLFKIKV